MVQPKFRHCKELVFGGRTFCCCLPVRLGVIVLSLLGILFAGALSFVLWFEVANGNSLTSAERSSFVVIALVETLLLAACLLGFIGVVVRKQLFVQIYAYFLYFHLLLNVGVAIFLLYLVSKFSTRAAYHICVDTIKNSDAQQQCEGFLQVANVIYFAISTTLILIEMYAAIVVARYVNQIQQEKRLSRAERAARAEERAYKLHQMKAKNVSYSSLQDREGLLSSPGVGFGSAHSPGLSTATFVNDADPEFNPYDEANPAPSTLQSSDVVDEEYGYAGGSWTHAELAKREKERLKQDDLGEQELDVEEQRRTEVKSKSSPPTRFMQLEELPRYTLSDAPIKRVD